MAISLKGPTVPGRVAGADLSADQYKIVKMSAGKAVLSGAGERALGVLGGDPKDGEAAEILSVGSTAKVRAGAGGLVLDDEITSDAAALGVTAGAGDWILGQCIEAAAAGEIGSVFITLRGQEV